MQYQAGGLTPWVSPSHAYGAMIRSFREAAKMSQTDLAVILGYSRAHVSRFEKADRAIPPDVPAKLDKAFGTTDVFSIMYEPIKNDVFPNWARQFVTLASSATRIREYGAAAVPGLIQTADYARALLLVSRPQATTEQVNEGVEARMSRQAVLTRESPTHLMVVLDEAVLRRPVGGPSVMADQLEHLLGVCELPNVIMQVVPFVRGAHPLMGGSLTLLTQSDGTQAAYLEGSHTGQLIEDVSAVAGYELTYDLLRASTLTLEASEDMIRAALEECTSCELPMQRVPQSGVRAHTATGRAETASR